MTDDRDDEAFGDRDDADVDAFDPESAVDADLDAELAALLADPSLWAEPDPSLEQRTVDAVVAAASAAAVADAPGAPVAESPVAPVVSLADRRRRRFVGPLVGAAVGAAAALLGVLVVGSGDDDGGGGFAGPPDAVITLTGTELAPSVSGTAELTTLQSGVAVRIMAPGLPRRDGDEFYEGWLRSCDGTRLVPIGTFHELDDTLGWAGASLADHPILTITLERAAAPTDPGQGSSGEVVVRGNVAPCPG